MRDEWDLERFRAGDPAFFRELVEALSPRLLGAAQSFADSLDQAHDLVQATWTSVWEKRGQFRGEADLPTWILAILYRTCLQERRHRERRTRLTRSMVVDLTPGSPKAPDEVLELAERMRELHERMGRLSAKEMEVALLTFRDGLTSAEVGERLRIGASTVRVHIANIRKKLREARSDT